MHDTRLDLYTDNKALCDAWAGQGSRKRAFNEELKRLFRVVLDQNIDIQVKYIRTEDNPADRGSRSLSAMDVKLSVDLWRKVEQAFGPHSCDLMALDSNSMCSDTGEPLKHYTPHPTP